MPMVMEKLKYNFYIHNQSCSVEREFHGRMTAKEIVAKIMEIQNSGNFKGFTRQQSNGEITLIFQDK
jgi:hypothetical protein